MQVCCQYLFQTNRNVNINYAKLPNPAKTFRGRAQAKNLLSKESQLLVEKFEKKYNFKELKPIQWRMKRGLDYAGAAIGLVLSSPVMAASAIAIKLETKGPIIFKQERIGKGGKAFTMYKFRNMYNSAPQTYFKMQAANDPNITKVGRFLRKYSLDELPQLVNILKGEMSFVGPRPIVDETTMVKLNPDAVRRFAVRPGAKLNYKTLKDDNLLQKIEVEKAYLDNWNLLSDFKIIGRIIKDMATGNNR